VSASPEAIRAIDTVARQLGELRDRVVFIGGVVRGLLITDTAVQGSRATKDVDVIAAGITTRAEYYSQIHSKLRSLRDVPHSIARSAAGGQTGPPPPAGWMPSRVAGWTGLEIPRSNTVLRHDVTDRAKTPWRSPSQVAPRTRAMIPRVVA
jgi:hypothetical protein